MRAGRARRSGRSGSSRHAHRLRPTLAPSPLSFGCTEPAATQILRASVRLSVRVRGGGGFALPTAVEVENRIVVDHLAVARPAQELPERTEELPRQGRPLRAAKDRHHMAAGDVAQRQVAEPQRSHRLPRLLLLAHACGGRWYCGPSRTEATRSAPPRRNHLHTATLDASIELGRLLPSWVAALPPCLAVPAGRDPRLIEAHRGDLADPDLAVRPALALERRTFPAILEPPSRRRPIDPEHEALQLIIPQFEALIAATAQGGCDVPLVHSSRSLYCPLRIRGTPRGTDEAEDGGRQRNIAGNCVVLSD